MSLFDNFAPQKALPPDRKARASREDGAAGLEKILERVLATGRYPATYHYAYEQGQKLLPEYHFDATALRAFTLRLVRWQEHPDFFWKIGALLAGLCERADGERIELFLRPLAKPVDRVGYMNRKHVSVRGDAGERLGYRMSAGCLELDGSAGDGAGTRLGGGALVIAGDAGDQLGLDMEDGVIELGGNAGDDAARGMRGGTITIARHAGARAAYLMAGGTLRVGGSVGDELAAECLGGEVHIEGSAGRALGHRMRAGDVHVARRIGQIAESLRGGRVTRGKTLIIDDGQPVR